MSKVLFFNLSLNLNISSRYLLSAKIALDSDTSKNSFIFSLDASLSIGTAIPTIVDAK